MRRLSAQRYWLSLGDLEVQVHDAFGVGGTRAWMFSLVSRNAAEWTGVLMSNHRYPDALTAVAALQDQLAALRAQIGAVRPKPPPKRPAKRKRR